ncbi:MAG: PRTRC system ParB family protein [Gammaproteobacteria bacterium]|nr:MAG: PRTRC system ParB family protein [Gammaproteobacteria bacterium]
MNAQQTFNPTINYSLLKDGDAFRAPLKDIDPVPWGNVRSSRDPEAFKELRAAIKSANGVTQGVTVRINPDDPTRLQLIAGYGRVEASNLDGYIDIPAVFKVADDRQSYGMMMTENFAREKLSIADEIVAAQKFVSYYNSDYEAAANALNWSVNKLRGRLLLNQCTETVRDALRQDLIKIGHAEILSAFVPTLQDGTLATIISEKWSIEYLKERAGRANRNLRTAIFDVSSCAGCPHNSDVQADIFVNTVGKAKCNNLPCFKEKTDIALALKKSELEEQFGVVLMAIEKPLSDRNTVNEEIVGSGQFIGGCTGCLSNVVILTDGINSNAGEVVHNQCIDTDCFRKMKVAFSAQQISESADAKNVSKDVSKNTPTKVASVNKATKHTLKENVVTQTTTAAVLENNKSLLRSLAASHFDTNSHFMEAVCVSALIDHAGFSSEANTLFKSVVTTEISTSFNKRVIDLFALTSEKLNQLKTLCYSMYLKDSKNMSTDPRALLINALSLDVSGNAIAVSGWSPTKENLNAYLKQGLIGIAKTSGFENHFNSLNGENAFDKIAKKPKTDLIDAILNTQFDWSMYAPDDFIKCLK